MKSLRLRLAAFAVIALILGAFASKADELPATLSQIHDVLVQAAGEDSDTPPPNQQQLLAQALKMIRTAPAEDYRGLRIATHDINLALAELAKGNATHRARSDILDAADVVKTMMD